MTARERRTVTIGAAIVVVSLFIAYGVLPFVDRWRSREMLIAARADRLARIEALVREQSSLANAARAWESSLDARPQRIVGARTPALAASAVQSLLQRYGAESGVQVTRVDVASAPDTSAGLPAIPATVAATGDVHGLYALLDRIERGERVLVVGDVAVQSVRGPRGEELLQLSVAVHAPFAEVP